jgi:hypothetical protein
MTRLRWPARLPPDELGAVVHGPVVLARSRGITAGLRCVFAHPGGLHLLLVLRAVDVQAEAAGRHSGHHRGELVPPGPDPWSGMVLTVEMDGESRTADPAGQVSGSHTDRFDLEADYWIGRLPRDRRLQLTAAWPQAGLTASSTLLQLDDLDDLGGRVLSLR